MADVPQYVADASIVGLWYLKDQQYFEQAVRRTLREKRSRT